jgi:hypothetical protein
MIATIPGTLDGSRRVTMKNSSAPTLITSAARTIVLTAFIRDPSASRLLTTASTLSLGRHHLAS